MIYDRIRENLARGTGDNLAGLLNRSNNECLSRTTIPSATTLLAVLSLLVLGGAVIHDFAFALFVGIVAGTYSSIYVATPLVLERPALFERRAAAVSRPAVSHLGADGGRDARVAGS